MRRRAVLSAVVLFLLASGGLLELGGPVPANSASAMPGVRLIGAVNEATLVRWSPEELMLSEIGIYLAPVGGPLELRARRSGRRVDVRQVTASGGVTNERRLPPSTVRSLNEGLRDFFDVTISTASGETVERRSLPFCPQPFFTDARVDDSGPDAQRYPMGCFSTEVTTATVWGVDEGWAVSVPNEEPWSHFEEPDGAERPQVADGTYDVEVAITPRYLELFNVDPADAVRTVRVTITTMDDSEEPEPGVLSDDQRAGPGPHGAADQVGTAAEVDEDASGLPELVALPPRDFEAFHDDESGRDYLAFAATVWNAGPGPLVVEGFREPGKDVMQAFQYFYEDGTRVGRSEVGTLEYDPQDGHEHWHFTDFARYRLLDRASGEVVQSEKEAFCLADTDPVDLTVPGARWRGDSVDLHTACGAPTSLWIREVLNAGWGDTYQQWLPGQSFDVTDVPNGSYLVEVTTNPDGRLRERETDNNVAVRRVRLGGDPGARTVRPQG